MIALTCNAVGDIMAIATLIIDIARALNESRGSASEYRAFTAELNTLHIVLISVSRVAEFTTDVKLRAEIVSEVDRCSQGIQHALERVAKFSTLGHDGDTKGALRVKLKRQWYKLEWRFGKRESVQDVQAEFAAATRRLSAYLAISSVDGMNNLRISITDQFNAMTARICTSLVENFAAAALRDSALSDAITGHAVALGELRLDFRRGLPTTPASSGSSLLINVDSNKAIAVALLCVLICAETTRAIRNALLLAAVCLLTTSGMTRTREQRTTSRPITYTQSNSITLNDALGRSLVLPFELCATYDVFHATLVNLFSHTNGRWFIEAYRYAISPAGRETFLDASTWDFFVAPGMELDMDIVVQLTLSQSVYVCPVCLSIMHGSVSTHCPCSSCGKVPTEDWVDLTPFETRLARGAQAMVKTSGNIDDWGRFPRSRPISSERIQHRHPRRAHGLYADSAEVKRDRPTSFLDWAAQVKDFKHIQIHTPTFDYGLCETHYALDMNYSELRTAVENGHYALVANLLDRGADVNACFGPGCTTPLHLACFHGHTELVALLLDYGAAIDTVARGDVTPLACALSHVVDKATSKLLLARGAIVDAPKSAQAVAFILAALTGNVDLVKMLLRLGVDVNTRLHRCGGETALHAAVSQRNGQIVQILLQHGADANARSEWRKDLGAPYTPLALAARFDVGYADDIVEALFASAGMFGHVRPSIAIQEEQRALLHHAICGGSIGRVEIVLRTGVDVNVRFQNGTTPLSFASERGDHELVKLLLAHGADPATNASLPSSMEKQGSWKALHAAAHGGYVQVVEVLLQHGVDVNACTDHVDTPLSLALKQMRKPSFGHRTDLEEVVNTLLSWGAIVDERWSYLMQESTKESTNNYSRFKIPGTWRDDSYSGEAWFEE